MPAWLCQGTDLHMARLTPLQLTISCCSKSRLVLPFWCQLTQVVLDKIQEGRKTFVCVTVSVWGVYLPSIPPSSVVDNHCLTCHRP